MSIIALKNFVLDQRDAATLTLQPWAGARGGAYDRVIEKHDERSRPDGIIPCRGTYVKEGLLALVLLAGSFGSKERLKGVSVAVTQLLNSKELWDYCMSKEELVREINRLLSLGPDQQTTLVDEIIRRHRSVKITGRGQDALSQLGQVLYLLGFFTYENTDDEERESDKYYTVVDGHVIKQIRDICAAVSSEYSHLTGVVHIEMALSTFFQMAVGDEKLAKLLAFVFAHCLFGAVGMVVARECCKQFRETLAAVAFNEDFLKARQDLVLALDGGEATAVADAVAVFKGVWASLEGQAREAYDREKAARIFDQMQYQDLYQDRDQQTTLIEALKTASGKVTAFAYAKGCVSVGGAKPPPVGVVRVELTAASLTEELEGLQTLRNTSALKSDVAAFFLAVGNLGVTNRLDAPLQPHLRGYGPDCQMVSYLYTFFRSRSSALLASIQADVWVYFHEERRWLHSSRPGQAAIDYSLFDRAIDADYQCVEAYLRDRRNSTDVTTLRCVREYRADADAWDAAYEEPAEALLEEHRAYVAELDALTAAGQENGGRLAGTTVFLFGTRSYNSRGALYGSGGEYGARIDDWTGAVLWETTGETSTGGIARALAMEGATIVDASTMIGREQVEAPRGVEISGAFDALDVALLGASKSMHELKGDVVAAVPNDWEASQGHLDNRYGQFQSGGRLYREQLWKEFLESGATDFFGWARRREFTTHYLGEAPRDNVHGNQSMTEQWLPRASTGDATYLIAGDARNDVRRSARRAPAPAPAAAPAAAIDDELDEGYDRPKWAEGSRTYNALRAIFDANPKLISDPPPDREARRAIAKRLCKPNPSTAPDDVRLHEEAFAWGDDQWAQWHLDNDSSDDDDEEMGEFDPFSEENVPRATHRNGPAIRDLFKRRFKKDAPIRATFQSKLFGDLLGYLRQCIIRDVYP